MRMQCTRRKVYQSFERPQRRGIVTGKSCAAVPTKGNVGLGLTLASRCRVLTLGRSISRRFRAFSLHVSNCFNGRMSSVTKQKESDNRSIVTLDTR
ncbi:hypothetical protein V5799_027500 [Amblyomma americanum]|uniref:Uncharacterized protein n=1 Tax=Amblyomma americanum TaxID=6943 RepID=A0AAQ4DFJ3_AMBAM